jgi:5-methylcytosine-specific restriction endonuclease McrA
LANGGTNVLENFVPACRECNIKRGARDPSVLRYDVPGAEDW